MKQRDMDLICIGGAGVDLYGRQVKTDPDRLTALVILGIQDEELFPLIFYREKCALITAA